MTYQVLICGNEEQYVLVDEGRFTLGVGEVWAFSSVTGQILCGTVVQPSPFGTPNFAASTQYEGCGDCLEATTIYITANTIEDICVVLCDPTDVVEANTPHPIWIGLYGEQITQGNAVVLGGPNGLNS